MIYYNQNNYPDDPYEVPGDPEGKTIATSGCGICSMAMIVSNMTSTIVDPIFMDDYAERCGARVIGGTDMNILAAAICKDYPLSFTTSNDEGELQRHLQSGGMAVANVGGDRPGHIGVFSDGGHFIVSAILTDDGLIGNLDPGNYDGKFNKPGRAGKVIIAGDYCYCSVDTLAADTANRDPAYWLFTKEAVMTEQWKLDLVQEAKKEGIITSDHDPDEQVLYWAMLAIGLNILKLAKGDK